MLMLLLLLLLLLFLSSWSSSSLVLPTFKFSSLVQKDLAQATAGFQSAPLSTAEVPFILIPLQCQKRQLGVRVAPVGVGTYFATALNDPRESWGPSKQKRIPFFGM